MNCSHVHVSCSDVQFILEHTRYVRAAERRGDRSTPASPAGSCVQSCVDASWLHTQFTVSVVISLTLHHCCLLSHLFINEQN